MSADHRLSICREGWAYILVTLIVLAAAILRQINLLMALFGMMAAIPILSWRVVQASLKRLEIRRKAPESISAGDLLVVEIEAVNGASVGRNSKICLCLRSAARCPDSAS